jgi:hypothetical protein
MSASSIHRLQLVLLGLFFAGAAIAWPHLPPRIALHFGFSGRPDRWVSTTWMAWFGLPLLAAAMTLFLLGIDKLLQRSPQMWNVPDKERFLRMSPAEREPIESAVHRLVAWCAVLITCSFIGAELEVYRSARASALPGWTAQLLVWAPAVLVLVLAFRMNAFIRKQIRRGSATQGRASA